MTPPRDASLIREPSMKIPPFRGARRALQRWIAPRQSSPRAEESPPGPAERPTLARPERNRRKARIIMGDKSPKQKDKAKKQDTKEKSQKAANAKNKANQVAPKKKQG
jgi:hypothetical protein